MRERLIELLKVINEDATRTCPRYSVESTIKTCNGCQYDKEDGSCDYVSREADYILADGWIRPPCKVGDKVYFVARNSGKPIGTVDEIEIVMIGKTKTGFCAKGMLGENTFDIIPHFEIDNYTFFASREEAEKALKGGAE